MTKKIKRSNVKGYLPILWEASTWFNFYKLAMKFKFLLGIQISSREIFPWPLLALSVSTLILHTFIHFIFLSKHSKTFLYYHSCHPMWIAVPKIRYQNALTHEFNIHITITVNNYNSCFAHYKSKSLLTCPMMLQIYPERSDISQAYSMTADNFFY